MAAGTPSSGSSPVVILMSSTELTPSGVLANWCSWENGGLDRHCASSWLVLTALSKKKTPVLRDPSCSGVDYALKKARQVANG